QGFFAKDERIPAVARTNAANLTKPISFVEHLCNLLDRIRARVQPQPSLPFVPRHCDRELEQVLTDALTTPLRSHAQPAYPVGIVEISGGLVKPGCTDDGSYIRVNRYPVAYPVRVAALNEASSKTGGGIFFLWRWKCFMCDLDRLLQRGGT